MQVPGSRIPPLRAATVAGDLYKPCAYLRLQYLISAYASQIPNCKKRALTKPW